MADAITAQVSGKELSCSRSLGGELSAALALARYGTKGQAEAGLARSAGISRLGWVLASAHAFGGGGGPASGDEMRRSDVG